MVPGCCFRPVKRIYLLISRPWMHRALASTAPYVRVPRNEAVLVNLQIRLVGSIVTLITVGILTRTRILLGKGGDG